MDITGRVLSARNCYSEENDAPSKPVANSNANLSPTKLLPVPLKNAETWAALRQQMSPRSPTANQDTAPGSGSAQRPKQFTNNQRLPSGQIGRSGYGEPADLPGL